MLEQRKCGQHHSSYYCCPEPGNELPNDRTCGQSPPVYRITRGKEVELNSLPWMAMLLYRNTKTWYAPLVPACGGSLINNRYVLTAVHCLIKGPRMPSDLQFKRVRLGEHDTSSEIDCEDRGLKKHCAPRPLEIDVEKYILHPRFNESDVFHFDIALLRLEIPVRYTPQIRPICVLVRSFSLSKSKLKVAGWGRTETGIPSAVLLQTTVVKQNAQVCQKAYFHLQFTSSIQICAGYDTCNGDSGGPLTATYGRGFDEFEVVVGITSYGGQQCGTKQYPSVFTKVKAFTKWIKRNLEA
ncbi:spaetzle-processing enzyme-like isoform X2 [Drosophila gunungcola]|nr:spaetzle-processing enzyme-like isoform X2 [Drosophila gunungcola]